MSLGNWLNQPCGSTGRSAWVHRRLSKAGCWPGSGNLPRKDPPPLPPRFHPPPLTRDHSGNFGNEHSPILSLPATHKWAGCPVHKAGTQDPPSTPVLIFTIMTTMIITMTMILQSDSRQNTCHQHHHRHHHHHIIIIIIITIIITISGQLTAKFL